MMHNFTVPSAVTKCMRMYYNALSLRCPLPFKFLEQFVFRKYTGVPNSELQLPAKMLLIRIYLFCGTLEEFFILFYFF